MNRDTDDDPRCLDRPVQARARRGRRRPDRRGAGSPIDWSPDDARTMHDVARPRCAATPRRTTRSTLAGRRRRRRRTSRRSDGGASRRDGVLTRRSGVASAQSPAKQTYLVSTYSSMPYFDAFAADARLLHAAERRDLGDDEAGVDADHAVLERFGDAPDAADVARVEVRREPELGAVRELDHLVVGREADQRRDRTERLLAEDLHLRRDVRSAPSARRSAAERVPLAADRDLRAAARRVGDVVLDLLDRVRRRSSAPA